MLMALRTLVTLVTPYEDTPSLRLVLGAVATQPALDVLLAAGLTWMAHSSVAVVLLVLSLAAQGTVPPQAAFALVLGANLGTAINPVLEGVSGDDPVARRLPIGNLLNRLLGVVVALALRIGWRRAGSRSIPIRCARWRTSTPCSTCCWRRSFSRCWGRGRLLLRPAAAGPGGTGRSRAAALPGAGGAGDTADCACRRGARGAADGGRAGNHADRGGRGADRQQSPAHRPGAPAGQRAGQAEQRHPGLPDLAG